MRRPIKHVLDDTVIGEAGNAIRNIHLVQGVTAADPYNAAQSQVNAGSAIVTSILLLLEVTQDCSSTVSSGLIDRFDWYVWFNIAGAQSAPDPRIVGQNDLKNQVFHQGHAVIGGAVTAQITLQNARMGGASWEVKINIPKWAQKINKDDLIDLVYIHSDAAANKFLKLKAIFMEYEQA